MFSWSSSIISKIQKLLVYWVAKLCLSVLCTSLALTNTIQQTSDKIAIGPRNHRFLGNFSNSFLKQMIGRWFLAPALSMSRKETQIWALQNSHSPWIYYLLLSVEQFLLKSHWVKSQWPILLGNFFLGFLFPVTGTDFIWGWFLKECKEWPPVRDFYLKREITAERLQPGKEFWANLLWCSGVFNGQGNFY